MTERGGARETARSTVKARSLACLAIIGAGLSVRAFGPGLGLPFVVTKYGGSALWAVMVFFLVALAVGLIEPATSARRMAIAAGTIAVLVEFSRLIHAPLLDTFRLSTAGALLLGRVFSLWNLVAYLVGTLAAATLDRALLTFVRRARRHTPRVKNTRT